MQCEKWLCGKDVTHYIKVEFPVTTSLSSRIQEEEAYLCDKHIRNLTRSTKKKGGRVIEKKTLREMGF